jgi:hypothetical protein
MNDFETWIMLIFSLGFFLYTIRIVTRDHRESWEHRMMEAREFGPDAKLHQKDSSKSKPNEK